MDAERARELLDRERARIEGAVEELRRRPSEELADVDQHPADTAGELYEDEVGEGMADRLREELEAIERAGRRLEEGTYGRSIESGDPIPDARLEIVPWAERTAVEQERYESRRRGT